MYFLNYNTPLRAYDSLQTVCLKTGEKSNFFSERQTIQSEFFWFSRVELSVQVSSYQNSSQYWMGIDT